MSLRPHGERCHGVFTSLLNQGLAIGISQECYPQLCPRHVRILNNGINLRIDNSIGDEL